MFSPKGQKRGVKTLGKKMELKEHAANLSAVFKAEFLGNSMKQHLQRARGQGSGVRVMKKSNGLR